MNTIKEHSLPKEKLEWIGISESEFQQYQQYINNEAPGYCGSYSAATVSHYILTKVEQIDVSMELLLNGYRGLLEDVLFYPGTYLWDVKRGLKEVLGKGFNYQVKTHLFAEKKIPAQLAQENPLPAIVGTVGALGSRYKNHWVVVYAYARDSSGKLWFKIYDNHGQYKKVIPAVQTLRCCWVEQG